MFCVVVIFKYPQYTTATGVNMSPPPARVNTFIQEKSAQITNLDRISKIFIISEMLCGINRISVLGNFKTTLITISLIFSVSINIIVVYFSYMKIFRGFEAVVKTLKLCQYLICTVLGFALRKKLNKFYSELDTFDKESGLHKINKETILNLAQLYVTFGFIIFVHTFLHVVGAFRSIMQVDIMVLMLIHIVELHFFGHLFSLLTPRLRCINRLIKSSCDRRSGVTTVENELDSIRDTKFASVNMRKLMDYYQRIIISFDLLNEAIRWQMLSILVTSFVSSLAITYRVTLLYFRGEDLIIRLFGKVIMASFEMIPLFGPCRVADAVHEEVRSLIEQLSSKLYENKIDKSDRPVAQALLALMEARDLSFSLFRVFDIDVSFPFKFLGLLVTYLIIMLQFDKVIHLDRPATS